jgi:hypothetical protein
VYNEVNTHFVVFSLSLTPCPLSTRRGGLNRIWKIWIPPAADQQSVIIRQQSNGTCQPGTANCKLGTGNLFLSPVKQIFAQHHQQEGKCSTEDHPDKSDEEFPETENFEIKQDKMMDEDQDQAIIDEPFDILVL